MSLERVHPVVESVTAAIGARSRVARERYLRRIRTGRPGEPPAIAIVPGTSAAHDEVNGAVAVAVRAARAAGAVAETPSRVPSPCAGGRHHTPDPFGDDPVALATTAALTRCRPDGVLLLDACAPLGRALLLGVATAGHLPTVVAPAVPDGPGPALLDVMGLRLPGGGTVAAAAARLVTLARPGLDHLPLAQLLDERAVVNGLVAALATGAPATLLAWVRQVAVEVAVDVRRAAVDRLAAVVRGRPPAFGPDRAVDPTAMLVQDLLEAGMVHGCVRTVAGTTLHGYGAGRRTPLAVAR